MKEVVLTWIGVIFGLVFLYLVVRNPQGTSSFIRSLSQANTNAILALQGNTPQQSFG